PVLEHPLCHGTPRVGIVGHDHLAELRDILVIGKVLQLDHLQVTAQRPKFERAVEHIRAAAAHPGREVPARRTENDHASAGHVLTAMISDTLDHGSRPAISNGKTLAGLTANIY